MIFPLVITSVAALIYIVINLYLALMLQTSIHLSLRNECGESSQTVYRQEVTNDYQWKKEWIGLRPAIKMEEVREYRIESLFKSRLKRIEEGSAYVVDEDELIRIRSLSGEES